MAAPSSGQMREGGRNVWDQLPAARSPSILVTSNTAVNQFVFFCSSQDINMLEYYVNLKES